MVSAAAASAIADDITRWRPSVYTTIGGIRILEIMLDRGIQYNSNLAIGNYIIIVEKKEDISRFRK